jgi:hypothetical protein
MSPRVIPSWLGRRETQLLLVNYFALTSFYDSVIWRLAKANLKMETSQSGLTSLNNSGIWRTYTYSFQCFFPKAASSGLNSERTRLLMRRNPTLRAFIDDIYIPHLMFVVFGCSRMKAETTLGTGIDSVMGKLIETWLPLALIQR